MGLFMELGMKLDNLIIGIKVFIKNSYLKSFYYKWRFYVRLQKNMEIPYYYQLVDQLYINKQLYKWQYEKLKSLKRKEA